MKKTNTKDSDKQPVKTPDESQLPMGKRVQREVLAWFWVGLIFLLINGTIGQARVIPSGSMENTLLIGDHLIMSRLGYDAGIPFTGLHVSLWRNPKRQEIIIFKPPFAPDQPDYVKRVIGLPGDMVDIRDGSVWINGQKLAENYTTGPTDPAPPDYVSPYPNAIVLHFPYKVPPHCYLALGDNRGDSLDSRFWGCVPRKAIIGTPVMIYMSLRAPGDAWEPGNLRERFLAYADAIIHPSTVRWHRLFHIF
ncbi:MAG TPA: signal peptidase I [Candidatus Acidoferrum sp.]|nr:signal peptidase I [Candidatus Acidoferrum sp.]